MLDSEISLENIMAYEYKNQIMALLEFGHIDKANLYVECFRRFIVYNYKKHNFTDAEAKFHYEDYSGLLKYCIELQGEIK